MISAYQLARIYRVPSVHLNLLQKFSLTNSKFLAPTRYRFSSIPFRLQSPANMERINTEKAAQPVGPYSQAVVANGTIYVSGQIPANERGELVEGSITEKTRVCCTAVKNIVEAAGSSMDKVVRATVWLVDMADFAEVNKEYEKFFVSKPARTCIAVKQLPKGVSIEIEAIALK